MAEIELMITKFPPYWSWNLRVKCSEHLDFRWTDLIHQYIQINSPINVASRVVRFWPICQWENWSGHPFPHYYHYKMSDNLTVWWTILGLLLRSILDWMKKNTMTPSVNWQGNYNINKRFASYSNFFHFSLDIFRLWILKQGLWELARIAVCAICEKLQKDCPNRSRFPAQWRLLIQVIVGKDSKTAE